MSKALKRQKQVPIEVNTAGWFCFHFFEIQSTAGHFTVNLPVTFMCSVCAVLECIVVFIVHLFCQELCGVVLMTI